MHQITKFGAHDKNLIYTKIPDMDTWTVDTTNEIAHAQNEMELNEMIKSNNPINSLR